MKKVIKVTLVAIILAPIASHSQVSINIGNSYSIESSVFDTKRQIQVYTPEGYEISDKDYPVLYLLDGQRWFLQAVSYQKLFQEYGYTPDFIVVGIDTGDPDRFGFFRNTEKLNDFLQKDVITFIESNFKTSDERLLFGWQFAGAFVISTLVNNPEAFAGYIAASPIPINGSVLENLSKDLSSNSLFVTTSHLENQVNNGVEDFVAVLDSFAPPLKWKYDQTTSESISSFGHRTTPLSALNQGLRFHFNDYPLLEFDRLEDFNSIGGHDYVKTYYRNRSDKYGLPLEIPKEGMFFLLRLGLDSNDYTVFQTFMTEFIDKGIMDNTNMGWGTRYAEFSLQNKDYTLATSIYQELSDRFPENARPIHGLGKVSLAQNDQREARKKFELAVEIAKKSNDRRLSQYQADLEALKN